MQGARNKTRIGVMFLRSRRSTVKAMITMRRVSAIRGLGALALSGCDARFAEAAERHNGGEPSAGGVGRYRIAFASFGPLDSTLFIAKGDGTAPRAVLSMPGRDYNASFAPDGTWIVFTSDRAGTAQIFRVRPDGSGLQQLTDGQFFNDQGTLSPDGNSLAFVSDRGGRANLWLLDIGSGAFTKITQLAAGDFRPAWSPDGTWLAFSSDRDSRHPKFTFTSLHSTEIFIIRRDGSRLRRLTMLDSFAGSPAWSTDGESLTFYQCSIADVGKITSPRRLVGDTQIISVSVATGEVRVRTSGSGKKLSPRWLSPDRIAYVSGGPGGGIESVAGSPGARGQFCSPSWSADGNQMVFHREQQQGWPPHAKWKSLDAAFDLTRTGIFPSFEPSGKRYVQNDRTAGNLQNSILLVNADGSQRSVLFHDTERSALAPAWSPDGAWIAFGIGGFFQRTNGASLADIALVRSDGNDLRVLTDGTGNSGFPNWSPDSTQLVYRSSGDDQDGIHIIDVRTHAVRVLSTGLSHENLPTWSPKGDRIAFTANQDSDSDIFTVKPDGTDLRRLTSSPGNDAHCAWSPDGAWIAFTSSRGGFKDEAVLHAYNPQPYGDLYVMRQDGTDVRRLTDNQFEEGTPTWITETAKTV